MSLFSYINANSSQTSSSSGSLSPLYTTTLQQLASSQQQAATTAASAGASSGNGVTISAAATVAAATSADAKKDAATLTSEIRDALDQQYRAASAAGKASGKADLTTMSPRALSIIVLNGAGTFSQSEVMEAKAEMRGRDRAALLEAIATDFSATSLDAYQMQRVESFAGMSDEERAVRWTKL
ncbi:hypothetical protein [Sphingobium aquiterrae]|uniref:hypothetical protein n=1 Tax=Sphingobium aquiterrae TaxID=2038656 RepID=UPI00301B1FEB